MRRRDFLRAGAPLGLAGLAGCTGLLETQSASSSQFTTVENRKEQVYYPTHVDGMAMLGTGGKGRYRVGLMYSTPHAFWNVTGSDKSLVQVSENVTAHLMGLLWDEQTRTVLPTARISAEILKGGEEVESWEPWPMLSQNMGYHFGDNVELSGDGTYTARLSIGAMQARAMGAMRGAFGEQTSLDVEFEHSRSKLGDVSYKPLPDKKGKAGAIEPRDMTMPISKVPKRGDLPNVLATGVSGDADFVAFAPDRNPHFVADGKRYLAVSPRTPYNRYPLPFMSLSATLKRGGSTVFENILRPALDPDLGYHYGAAVDGVESGDSLTVTVDAPPGVARHEGYETAFMNMSKMEMTL